MTAQNPRVGAVDRPRPKAGFLPPSGLRRQPPLWHIDGWRMLEFAIQWLPSGGGDEFLLPEFGMTPRSFYQKLSLLLDDFDYWRIDPALAARLREMCAIKSG